MLFQLGLGRLDRWAEFASPTKENHRKTDQVQSFVSLGLALTTHWCIAHAVPSGLLVADFSVGAT
jgi:hypothetical protein